MSFPTVLLRNLRKGLMPTIQICVSRRAIASNIQQEEDRNLKCEDMPVPEMKNPFEREKIECVLCKYNVDVDYKNVKLLSQFVSPYTGRVYGRHITRLCKKQQERVEEEIKKSQSAGFMGYYTRDLAFVDDPKLFNPERPLRAHRF